MTTYYENASEYIENFDINAKIVDTEERDKMCELWDEFAYSKIYLMYLSRGTDEQGKDVDYWYKEEVYWSGWEWNEQNNHIHGIGTMRNVNDMDEQQKNHMAFDLVFVHIISEKQLQKIKKELSEKEDEKSLEMLELEKITNALLKYKKFHINYFKYIRHMNSGIIPGILDITYPIVDNVE